MPYKDPARRKQADRERKLKIKREIQRLKDAPCTDCGNKYPYWVMQFDHVRGVKVGDISRLVANRQLKKALEEIKKCDLVCANCHADRTYKRIIVV